MQSINQISHYLFQYFVTQVGQIELSINLIIKQNASILNGRKFLQYNCGTNYCFNLNNVMMITAVLVSCFLGVCIDCTFGLKCFTCEHTCPIPLFSQSIWVKNDSGCHYCQVWKHFISLIDLLCHKYGRQYKCTRTKKAF